MLARHAEFTQNHAHSGRRVSLRRRDKRVVVFDLYAGRD
jgi:hypothetical protein